MKYATKVNLIIGAVVLVIAGSLAYGLSAGPQPVEKLIVVDSRGKVVGNVVGTQFLGFNTAVAFRLEGRLFVLNVQRNGLLGFGTLSFESSNCTGTPYGVDLPAQFANNYLGTLYTISGGKAYEPSGPVVSNLIVNSYLDSDGVCQPQTSQDNFSPLRFVADLNRFFTPPFTLKGGAEEGR
jgi:hypothetical protein